MPGRALIKEADVVLCGNKKTRKVLTELEISMHVCWFLSCRLGEYEPLV